jgi:hypothetical protein
MNDYLSLVKIKIKIICAEGCRSGQLEGQYYKVPMDVFQYIPHSLKHIALKITRGSTITQFTLANFWGAGCYQFF